MAALNNFPRLQRIRALGQSMLNALNKFDGPSGEDGGYDRWNRWLKAWIRLEDCNGKSSGMLPQDDDSEDESEDESNERSDHDYDDDDDSGGWISESDEEEPE